MQVRHTLRIVWLPVALAVVLGATLALWAGSPQLYSDPRANVGLALFVIGLGLGAMSAASRSLNRLVRERTEQLALGGAASERAETALHDREQSPNSTLDAIRDALVVTDAQGRIARLNGAAEALAGAPMADLLGRPLREVLRIVDPETREPVDGALEAVLASPDTVGVGTGAVLLAGGDELRVSETGVPIRSRGGDMLGAVLALRDVTEDYALSEQLREANRLETVHQLAGGLAHDFNNLLAAIMGNAELLRIEEQGPNRFAVDEIIKASQRASNLTQQLLAFSREGSVDFQAVEVHDLMDDVLTPLGSEGGGRLTIAVALEAPAACVHGDSQQLLRALRAVCRNAREAMPAGGTLRVNTRNVVPTREMLLRHRSLEPVPHLQIRISDDGVGMPPEVRKRVFEPFFTTRRAPDSTGLGLSGAYGSIRSHGGVIEVDSEPGKGTTVTILLPLQQGGASELPRPEPVRHEGRVLIVDDDDGVRALSSRVLETLGYQVTTCSDGRLALDFFTKHHRDLALVLLDLTMPRLGGDDVFRRMRAIDPSIPVVIVSGYVQSPKAQLLLEQGARGVLWKPFHIDELANTVNRHVAPSEDPAVSDVKQTDRASD